MTDLLGRWRNKLPGGSTIMVEAVEGALGHGGVALQCPRGCGIEYRYAAGEFGDDFLRLANEKRRELGQKARLLVEREYTWKACGEIFRRILESLEGIEAKLAASPEDVDKYIDELEQNCRKQFESYSTQALALSDTRHKAATYLQKLMNQHSLE